MKNSKFFLYWLSFVFASSALGSAETISTTDDNSNEEQTCGWEDRESCSGVYRDKNLKPMTVKLEDGSEDIFHAYVLPDVATFYNKTEGSMEVTETSFQGMMAKFINMGREPIGIYWKPSNPRQDPTYISDVQAFGAAGTASYPGHHFLVTEIGNHKNVFDNFRVVKGNSLYVYDPYGSIEEARKKLSPIELEEYKLQYDNLAFNRLYERVTGRQWLALYNRKKAPKYPIWPADSFGQTHTVVTKETHVTEMPPDEFVNQMVPLFGSNPAQLDELKKYKAPEETLTLNMTVLSVAPRAFEIRNFLSEIEVQHILEVATGIKLHQSTTKAGSVGTERTDDSTRTSRNSWISRQRSPIIDSIIRRAADVLQVDEAYFRKRTMEERHLVPGSPYPINERIQLVHYNVGQQYTPHHDFAIPDTSPGQPSRFATILFYLNEVEAGGETSFPRWMNAEHKDILMVKPEIGKAVLFYNQLPDGNYDERSQHAARPVSKGEKWLTNLWVWDPHM